MTISFNCAAHKGEVFQGCLSQVNGRETDSATSFSELLGIPSCDWHDPAKTAPGAAYPPACVEEGRRFGA